MVTEWMGRYRALVAALVQHSNLVNKGITRQNVVGGGIRLSIQEWQIFEHILEHHDETFSMVTMSKRLGIPQSSFSRAVKHLCSCGLVDKYQAVNNRKNIILKPTDYGRQIYQENAGKLLEHVFGCFFEVLEPLSDQALATVTEAINTLNLRLDPEPEAPEEVRLVRKE